MKKICFLSWDYSWNGGGERMVCNLANHLCKENDVAVFSFAQNNREPLYKLDEQVSFKTLNIKRCKINFFTKFRHLNYILKNKELFSPFDVLIGEGFMFNLILGFCKKKLPCKMVAWEHFCFDKVRIYQKILRNILYMNLDKDIVLTQKDFPKYKRINSNTQIIHNFTEMKFRQKPNFQNKQFIFIGELSKRKGVDYLIKCIKKFMAKNSDWKFKIIGRGKRKKDLLKFVQTQHFEDRVLLQDVSNDVQTELENSSCILMTSRAEGLPMVLIEAQVCGLPAISFDTTTGPAEIIADKKSGFIVPVGNVNAFVDAMLVFASDAALQEKMHIASIEQGKKFDEAIIIAQWKKMLLEL